MRQIKKIDNHLLFVRESNKEEQSFSDYICENKVFMDGRPDESFLCLMENCHSVYFELWVDGRKDQRVGSSCIVNLKDGWKEGISSFVETELIEKLRTRIPRYVSHFSSEGVIG